MLQPLREASFRRLVLAVAVVLLALFLAGLLVSVMVVAVENATHDGGQHGTTFIVTTTTTP